MTRVSLMRIDVLPEQCSVTAELGDNRVRFQAMDADDNVSEWSGWFEYDGKPIALHWDAFWVKP